MTKTITKMNDLGCGWTGMLYSDGTMRLYSSHLPPSRCVDLPKASVDTLSRIFKEIQGDIPYTSNGKEA